jgi:hypothetical protein
LQEFRRFLFPIKRFRIFHGRLNALTQDRISQRSTKASFLFHHAQPVAFLKPLNGRGPRLVIQHGNQS